MKPAKMAAGGEKHREADGTPSENAKYSVGYILGNSLTGAEA